MSQRRNPALPPDDALPALVALHGTYTAVEQAYGLPVLALRGYLGSPNRQALRATCAALTRGRKHTKQPMACSEDDCTRPVHARGWCKYHYKLHGDAGHESFPARDSCLIAECDRTAKHFGMCGSHYYRQRQHGDPLAGQEPKGRKRQCSIDGCERQERSQRLCRHHYYEFWKDNRPICSIDDCERPTHSHGFCACHYQRERVYGHPLAGPPFRTQRGDGLPKWAYWQRRDEQRLAAEPDLLVYVDILHGDPCSYCGGVCEHIDHIDPVNNGGTLVVENVTAACQRCNVRKHATSLLMFLLKRREGVIHNGGR